MACSCQNKNNSSVVDIQTVGEPNPDCSYTLEELTILKNKLYCIKNQETFSQYNTTEQQINSYIGITISAIYYPSNFCYFESSLEEIKIFINNLDLSNCDEM